MLKRAAISLAAMAALFFVSAIYAPQLLAFPYKTQTAIGTVRSERPLDRAALDKVASRTGALLAQSPITEAAENRPIFLTDGGWRWLWLANTARAGFALTRPVSRAVVVNASNPARDVVSNGAPVAGTRSLSGTLAHEFTHGVLRRRYGLLAMAMQPQWKVEGYPDHVAQESSFSAEEVEQLEADGISHPALPYYYGRQRVAERLAANGGSVDDLFASND